MPLKNIQVVVIAVVLLVAGLLVAHFGFYEPQISGLEGTVSDLKERLSQELARIEELVTDITELIQIVQELTPPEPPPPSNVTQYFTTRRLLPGETWDVFYENLTYYPVGNRLDLSYKANASLTFTVSFGLDVVSEGRCEESEQNLKFDIEMQAEFKVVLENDSDFEIEVSVEITVGIDPDC